MKMRIAKLHELWVLEGWGIGDHGLPIVGYFDSFAGLIDWTRSTEALRYRLGFVAPEARVM